MTRLSLSEDARRLDSEPLSEQVYRALRDAITGGIFEPHAHLVQNQLAEELQVSRTPVRDALLRLSQEGVVRAVGARGFLVQEVTPRDVLNIYEVRIALEVDAAEAALHSMSPSDVDALARINRRIAETYDDKVEAFRLNNDFHMTLVRSAPNRLVAKILGDLWDMPVSRRVFMLQVVEQFDPGGMAAAHEDILSALARRDAEALRAAVLSHLVESRDAVKVWISDAEQDTAHD